MIQIGPSGGVMMPGPGGVLHIGPAGGPPAPTLWTPAAAFGTDLLADFDAQYTDGLTLNSGNVARMASRVGSIVASQATASNQTAFDEAARNGLPGLVCSTSAKYLIFDPSTLPLGAASSTTVVVGYKSDEVSSGDVFGWGSFSTAGNRGIAADPMRAIINGTGSNVTGSPTWTGLDRIVIWSAESAVANYWSIDGVTTTVSTVTALNTNSSIGCIGARAGSTSISWRGGVQQIMVIGRLVTTDERQRLEGWLAHRWALAALLPLNHPYKSAPPTM